MAITIENVAVGFYDSVSVGPTYGNIGSISTGGPNRLIVLMFQTGRANNATDINQITSITVSGLTFTRVLHDASWLYTDPAAPSFQVASQSIDIFTAPAPTQVTGITWSSTLSGDGFVNTGTGVLFAVAGLADINNPFDTHSGLPDVNINTSGTASAPNNTISTNASDGLLVQFINNHGTSSGDTTGVVSSGWTEIGHLNNASLSSGVYMLAQSKQTTSPQSGVTFTTSYTDKFWSSVMFAFNGDTTPSGTWATTENPDVLSFRGYPGQFGETGFLNATEAQDTFSATGYPATVGRWVTGETPDSFNALGFQPISGTFNITEKPDKFAATGLGYGVSGTWASVEAVDIFAATGYTAGTGTWASTETPDTFRAIGLGVISSRTRRVFFVT